MRQYLRLLQDILDNGTESSDRTGVGTLRKAGHILRFDLSEGFPLVTTKKVHLKSVVHELLWFLSGDTNIKYLVDNGVSIWTDWPLKRYNDCHNEELTQAEFEDRVRNDERFAVIWGDLGPVYGKQWRNFNGVDQIQNAIDLLRTKPDDRGIVVNAWNPPELAAMALRPCHYAFQLLAIDGKLNLMVNQRSCDTFLGLPFNIASYAFLCYMFAQQVDMEVGDLIWVGADVHLYLNHLDQAREQLSREPRPLPQLRLNNAESIFDYRVEDFEIVGYEHHPAIKALVAV